MKNIRSNSAGRNDKKNKEQQPKTAVKNQQNNHTNKQEPEEFYKNFLQAANSNKLNDEKEKAKDKNSGGGVIGGIFDMARNVKTKLMPSESRKDIEEAPKVKRLTHFYCECNEHDEFARLRSDSKSCCLRAFGWLKRKYSPFSMQAQLTKKYEEIIDVEYDEKWRPIVRKDVVRTFSESELLGSAEAKMELEK